MPNTASCRAPDLIALEVAGAVMRVARMAGFDPGDVRAILDRWLEDFGAAAVDMRRSSPSLLGAAGRLSIDLSHPIQNCLSLALATDVGANLATCDRTFHRKAAGACPRVRLLAEFA